MRVVLETAIRASLRSSEFPSHSRPGQAQRSFQAGNKFLARGFEFAGCRYGSG